MGQENESWWDEERIRAFLATAGLGDGPFDVSPLRGGYWNQVIKIAAPAGSYVLKHYTAVLPGTLFPNLPEAEALALERLAGLGVAPAPVGYWPQHQTLIYAFVEGMPWTGDVVAVAALLRRKEAAASDGFRLVPATPGAILAAGDRLYERCTDDALVAACRDRRPAPFDMAPPPRLSLIHTDIGATNLIGAGDTLRLIDWQCPAAGDLAEDIYAFVSPAFQVLNLRRPLPDDAIDEFFAALAMPEAEDRYRRLRSFYSYRMLGYCCLRQQTAGDEQVAARYRLAIAEELNA